MRSTRIPSADETVIPDVDDLAIIVPRSREDLSIRRLIRLLVYTLSFVIIVSHLYFAYANPMPRREFANIHLGLLIGLYYLLAIDFEPENWRDHYQNLINLTFLVAVTAGTVYVYFNFERWLNEGRMLLYNQVDVFFAVLLILTAIHATWRAFGKALAFVSFGALLFGYLGPYIPQDFVEGIFYHSGLSLERLIATNAISLNGVYSPLLGIGATWVAIFVFFAGIIEAYGGMDYIVRIGKSARNMMASGVMQTAVISSMLMGSISGAAAANVATTGSFTIPLMKSEGVDSKYAASIESIASTGGQILPPVMGSASFLMADILGIPYFNVIIAATLPALAFYATVAVIVHLTSIKHGWTVVPDENPQTETGPVGSRTGRLIEGFPYLVSFGFLLILLLWLRYSPLTSGMYSILVAIGLTFLRDVLVEDGLIRPTLNWGRRTIEGFKIGSEKMAPLTAVLASLGIIIQILTSTGFTQRFTLGILALASGLLIIAALLTMIASLLFGMGMPTPAAYIVVATLTAPVLVRFGIQPLTAHMFVFYFALISTITPPVALACAVASGIAECSFLEVTKETVRLGLFAFIAPFTFLANQELIYWSSPTMSWFIGGVVVIGFISIAVALVGHDGTQGLPLWQRGVYFGLGLVIFFVPNHQVQFGLAAVTLVWLVFVQVRTTDRWQRAVS